MVDQIYRGRSPNWTLRELQDVGVSVVMHSTPCLVAAHYGMEELLDEMPETGAAHIQRRSRERRRHRERPSRGRGVCWFQGETTVTRRKAIGV